LTLCLREKEQAKKTEGVHFYVWMSFACVLGGAAAANASGKAEAVKFEVPVHGGVKINQLSGAPHLSPVPSQHLLLAKEAVARGLTQSSIDRCQTPTGSQSLDLSWGGRGEVWSVCAPLF
jgi:hypothetical protein